MIFNGTDVKKVIFNGTDVTKIIMDGTTVFQGYPAFCALKESGTKYSYDGINWTTVSGKCAISDGASNSTGCIIGEYLNGNKYSVSTTLDNINWNTTVTYQTRYPFTKYSITYINDRFIRSCNVMSENGGTYTNHIEYSYDGTNWLSYSDATNPFSSGYYVEIATFSNNSIIANIQKDIYYSIIDRYISTDYGKTWTKANFPTDKSLYSSASNNDAIYGLFHDQSAYTFMYYSTDNGCNWELLNIPSGATEYYTLSECNGIVYFDTDLGDNEFYFTSTSTYAQVNGKLDESYYSLKTYCNGKYYSVTGGNKISTSFNGIDWTESTMNKNIRLTGNSIFLSDNNVLLLFNIVDEGYVNYYSTDDGLTWNTITDLESGTSSTYYVIKNK